MIFFLVHIRKMAFDPVCWSYKRYKIFRAIIGNFWNTICFCKLPKDFRRFKDHWFTNSKFRVLIPLQYNDFQTLFRKNSGENWSSYSRSYDCYVILTSKQVTSYQNVILSVNSYDYLLFLWLSIIWVWSQYLFLHLYLVIPKSRISAKNWNVLNILIRLYALVMQREVIGISDL